MSNDVDTGTFEELPTTAKLMISIAIWVEEEKIENLEVKLETAVGGPPCRPPSLLCRPTERVSEFLLKNNFFFFLKNLFELWMGPTYCGSRKGQSVMAILHSLALGSNWNIVWPNTSSRGNAENRNVISIATGPLKREVTSRAENVIVEEYGIELLISS